MTLMIRVTSTYSNTSGSKVVMVLYCITIDKIEILNQRGLLLGN
jgi:hypothetical protein